jgi:predicted AAA+ superfamily ATPase
MKAKNKLSKMKALCYLRTIEGEKTSLNDLKKAWGWGNHMQVQRYLKELEEDNIIWLSPSSEGTKIFFKPERVAIAI